MSSDNPADERRTATADEENVPTDDEPREEGSLRTSRRSVLGAAAATGVGAGFVGAGMAQQQGPTTIQLVGRTSGWEYEGSLDAPFIGGGPRENPTLNLTAGQQYKVVWENADGVPHNFAIRNQQGAAVVESEIISQEGATQTVTFTASQEMTTYLCQVHPNTMVGNIQMGGGGTGTASTMQEQQGFFEQGTEVGFRTVAEGMTAPTDMAVANEQQQRYFVSDQTGELWVVTPEGGRQEEPFINVSDRMVELGRFYGSYASEFQNYDERGLLGVDFHPDFQNNGRFFLHYSAPPTEDLITRGWDHIEVVSEFQASDDLSTADPESEQVLMSMPSPQYNHDAGPMAFGPDGYLYVPMGDGGGANDDMYGHAQDWYDTNAGGNGQDVEENLLGDVHRIDVDGSGAGPNGNYGIPQDNPFAGSENVGRDEIYAYGFRNPFGISFDSQGNLFVADAGQNLWEEANVVQKGGNYGWNVKEGTHCFSAAQPSDVSAITECPDTEPNQAPYDGSQLQDPIVEFPHSYRGDSVGITIVGGHRYEASTISGLSGKYVYGAWTADPRREQPMGRVLTATPPEGFGQGGGGTPTGTDTGSPTETTEAGGTGTAQGTGTPEGVSQGEVPRDQLWDMAELQFTEGFPFFVRQFGQDPNGEVYVLVNQRGVPQGDTGRVVQLVPPEEGETPPSTPTSTPTGTPSGTQTGTPEETGEGGGRATSTGTPPESGEGGGTGTQQGTANGTDTNSSG